MKGTWDEMRRRGHVNAMCPAGFAKTAAGIRADAERILAGIEPDPPRDVARRRAELVGAAPVPAAPVVTRPRRFVSRSPLPNRRRPSVNGRVPCPDCRRRITLATDGTVRMHGYRLGSGGSGSCPGTGRVPDDGPTPGTIRTPKEPTR